MVAKKTFAPGTPVRVTKQSNPWFRRTGTVIAVVEDGRETFVQVGLDEAGFWPRFFFPDELERRDDA